MLALNSTFRCTFVTEAMCLLQTELVPFRYNMNIWSLKVFLERSPGYLTRHTLVKHKQMWLCV